MRVRRRVGREGAIRSCNDLISWMRDVLKPRKTIIDYLYDTGDRWEHRLTVTGVRTGEPGVSYPRYISGERNGPPEDCGGIPGFYELLEALADPAHPDHAFLKQWAGDYDPDTFDALPIKYALGRIANRRNAARVRIARKKAILRRLTVRASSTRSLSDGYGATGENRRQSNSRWTSRRNAGEPYRWLDRQIGQIDAAVAAATQAAKRRQAGGAMEGQKRRERASPASGRRRWVPWPPQSGTRKRDRAGP